MPRMFDILRNKGDDDKEKERKDKDEKQELSAEEKNIPEASVSFPRHSYPLDTPAKKESQDHSLVSKKLISEVKKYGVDSEEKAKELYAKAVETINELLAKIKLEQDLNPYLDKIRSLLDDIFNQLILGDSILENIYEKRENEYYLPYHIVNVLLLSLEVGLKMGFNKSRIDDLGMAAIFFDAGLDGLKEIITQPRRLTEEERCWVEAHISKSLKAIEKISTLNEVVRETIQMHHERINGKGYPRGIKRDNINPYAKILGLIDTFEAIANGRPYVEGMNPHKTVKFIVSSLKDYFDPDVLRVFINKMSVYPVGSIVKLDTKELARVISVESGSPLRPVVMIIRNAAGEAINEKIIIDLSKQDFPSIQESI